MEFNANYKNLMSMHITKAAYPVKNVLGNLYTPASSKFVSNQTLTQYDKYYCYYGYEILPSPVSSNAGFPDIIVGSGTPTAYALGNVITRYDLVAESVSTGSKTGTKHTIRMILRNKSSETVTVSEIGLYVDAGTANKIPAPGNADSVMIASQTVDPVSVAPGEYIAIELVLDFPEVTE